MKEEKPKSTISGIIGFDIGRTIVINNGAPIDKRPTYPEVIRVMKRLISERFGAKNSFIISKVDVEQEALVRKWVSEFELCRKTGLRPENIHYCRERADKAGICRRLGITHFIDDRPEVISPMRGIVPVRILFQPNMEDYAKFKATVDDAKIVQSWREIEHELLSGWADTVACLFD